MRTVLFIHNDVEVVESQSGFTSLTSIYNASLKPSGKAPTDWQKQKDVQLLIKQIEQGNQTTAIANRYGKIFALPVIALIYAGFTDTLLYHKLHTHYTQPRTTDHQQSGTIRSTPKQKAPITTIPDILKENQSKEFLRGYAIGYQTATLELLRGVE